MAYFLDPIRNVAKWFGPRASGGDKGIIKTAGYRNEFMVDLTAPVKPGDVFPTGNGIYVTGVDTTYQVGTTTAVTIGGVAVFAATDAAPVLIPEGNTGVVVVTGATGGRIVIQFKNVSGDATHFY